MKKWRCTVCGYIHEGEFPPETCPVCGSPKEVFVEVKSEKDAVKGSDVTEADILVIGSGAAAFSAAITARNEGASVIMLEKGSEIGGTTGRSGGGFWTPNNTYQKAYGIEDNKEDCLKYMARYSYPHLYDVEKKNYGLYDHEYELLESYYDHAAPAVKYLEDCGAVDVIMEINWTGKPQVDYMDHLPENKGIRGRVLYPKNEEGKLSYGNELIRQFKEWADQKAVTILTDHEVVKLVRGVEGRVEGVEVLVNGERQLFKAKRGVIFGSGGYSHNPEYMLHFQRGPHYGGCSVPTNTGDFIRMGGVIGAQLGNTANAFRAQSMIDVYLKNHGGSSNVFYLPGDSMILVNKYGKRIVDEKRNYTDRTMVHFVWDAVKAEWTNMLTFMIVDERTATLWQGYPPYPVQGGELPSHILKGADLESLGIEIRSKLEELGSHTGGFQLDVAFDDNLRETIKRFNGFADEGVDLDFHRGESAYDREWTTFPPTIPGVEWPEKDKVNYTMYPLKEEGPYYAIILGAGTLDTNGGPIVNGCAQVLDYDNVPIKGLYGAGNCIASPTANAYWGAGSTIGPALTFGHIAALDALKDK